MGNDDNDVNSNEPLKELAEKAVEKLKAKVNSKIKKVLISVVSALLPWLLLFAAIIVLYGPVLSLMHNVWGIFAKNYPEMTKEEIELYMDDAENVYACLTGAEGALMSSEDAYNLLAPNAQIGLDRATMLSIFETIHDYNQKRLTEQAEITYTYRTETRDADADIPDMDVYGNLPSENYGNAEDECSTYDSEEKRTGTRREIEYEIGLDGRDIFELRWQPIFTACSIIATQRYGNWGVEALDSFTTGDLSQKEVGNYYLEREVVAEIVDLFTFETEYYFDILGDNGGGMNYYFLDLEKNTGAYKLTWDDYYNQYKDENGETQVEYIRKTKRIPHSAPNTISNGFETYTYNYSSESQDSNCRDRTCENRTYDAYAYRLIAAMQKHMPNFVKSKDGSGQNFDAAYMIDLFDIYIKLLPDPDDELYTFYIENLLRKYDDGDIYAYVSDITEDPDRCIPIGTVFSPAHGAEAPPEVEEGAIEGSDIKFTIETVNVSIPEAQTATIAWVSDSHIIPSGYSDYMDNRKVATFNDHGGYECGYLFENIVKYLNSCSGLDYVIFGGDIVDQGAQEFWECGVIDSLLQLKYDYMFLGAGHEYYTDLVDNAANYETQAMERIGKSRDGVVRKDFDGFSIIGQKHNDEPGNSGISGSYFGQPTILATHCPYGDESGVLDGLTEEYRDKIYNWSTKSDEHFQLKGSHLEFAEEYLFNPSNIKLVVSGHVHKSMDVQLNSECVQHVFAPAYNLTIGMIKVNGGNSNAVIEDEPVIMDGDVMFGDYNDQMRAPLTSGKYASAKNANGLSCYLLNDGAKRSLASPDGLSVEQWVKVLETKKGARGKTGVDPMFASDAAIRASAEAFHEWESTTGNYFSVAGFLAIRQAEGIGSYTPVHQYNFGNFTASTTEISNGWYWQAKTGHKFIDFYKMYSGTVPVEEPERDLKILKLAIKNQLGRLQRTWLEKRSRRNFKEFIFNPGYVPGDWSTLSLSYCPPYDGVGSFPFEGYQNSIPGWAYNCGTYLGKWDDVIESAK